MSTVNINGKTFDIPSGASVSVIGDKIYVNNVEYNESLSTKLGNIEITINGDVGDIKLDRGSAKISGNVGGSIDAGGSVTCNNISGNIDAGGSVKANSINCEKINAGGSVRV